MAAPPLPILFMTNAEHGQASVILAVAQEISRHPEFAVHVAATAPLRGRLEKLNSASKHAASPMIFHCLPGLSMQEISARLHDGVDISGNAHPPGFLGALKSYPRLEAAILGWEPSEYMKMYEGCLEAIQSIKPVALVCDLGYWQAHDAARSLNLRYISMAPCSAKEVAGGELPGAPLFLKWPAMGSGLKYPLSFIDMIKTFILMAAFVFNILRGRYYIGITKIRKAKGLKHDFPMLGMYRKDGLYLCPYLPSTDYGDFQGLPSNVIGCGPMIFPPSPVHKTDKELAKWLEQHPTVLINLGSHFSMDVNAAVEMTKGIKTVIESHPDLQVLWKWKYDWKESDEMRRAVGSLVDSDRLRIVPWLDVDPPSLLESEHIVCSVHHGGANSYYEACKAGTPQLIMPVWWDTYEFAERARYLGIGVIGNVGVAPGVKSSIFSAALLQVLGDEELKSRAKQVARACRDRGEGRVIAANEVMDWARRKKTEVPAAHLA